MKPHARKTVASSRRIKGGRDQRTSSAPVADSPRAKIPAGCYDAVCFDAKEVYSFGQRKLALRFRIYGGPFDGVEVAMFCNYPAGKLKPAFKLYRQWALALGRTPHQGERFGRMAFVGRMFVVDVRSTQERASDGNSIPEFLRYSKVETIIEPLTGGVPQ